MLPRHAHRDGGRRRALRRTGGDAGRDRRSVTTARLLAVLEPAITIALAVLVVILLLAVYLPMFTLYGGI